VGQCEGNGEAEGNLLMMPPTPRFHPRCPRCNKRRTHRRGDIRRLNDYYCLTCGHQWNEKKRAKADLDAKLAALDKKWKAKHGSRTT